MGVARSRRALPPQRGACRAGLVGRRTSSGRGGETAASRGGPDRVCTPALRLGHIRGGRERPAAGDARRLAGLVGDPEEQARHLALGASAPDVAVAAALDSAAAQARGRGAWDAAAELLEQAGAFTGADEPTAADERCFAAAEHHVHAGDRPRARALLERLLERAPPGRLRSEALRLLAEVRYNEDSFATVPGLLAEALEHTDDPALSSRLELTLAYVYCQNLFDFAAGDRHAQQALRHALRLGDGAVLGEALAFNAMVGFLIGRGVDWDAVKRSIALGPRIGCCRSTYALA